LGVVKIKKKHEMDNLRSSSSKKRRLKTTVESTPTFISNNLNGHIIIKTIKISQKQTNKKEMKQT